MGVLSELAKPEHISPEMLKKLRYQYSEKKRLENKKRLKNRRKNKAARASRRKNHG